MNSKFLHQHKTSLLFRLFNQSHPFNRSNARFFNVLFVDKIKNQNDSNLAKTQALLQNERLYLTQQTRGVLRGGTGYTHFAHGRKKLEMSTYGKFYIAFLIGSFIFVCLFDWEWYLYRGTSPDEANAERKQLYDKLSDMLPRSKAKEIDSEANSSLNDTNENTESESEIELSDKKHKSTFRERKVTKINLNNHTFNSYLT
jgi:hypothetical protein